ncbi:uncharacterized protein LOC120333346 [Styela clava]
MRQMELNIGVHMLFLILIASLNAVLAVEVMVTVDEHGEELILDNIKYLSVKAEQVHFLSWGLNPHTGAELPDGTVEIYEVRSAYNDFRNGVQNLLCGNFMCLYGSECKMKLLEQVYSADALNRASETRSRLSQLYNEKSLDQIWSIDYVTSLIKEFSDPWGLFNYQLENENSEPSAILPITTNYFSDSEWLFVQTTYVIFNQIILSQNPIQLLDRFAGLIVMCECSHLTAGVHCEQCISNS